MFYVSVATKEREPEEQSQEQSEGINNRNKLQCSAEFPLPAVVNMSFILNSLCVDLFIAFYISDHVQFY